MAEEKFEVVRIEIAKLEWKPGDTIIVNFSHLWGNVQIQGFNRWLVEQYPDLHFLVVPQDTKFTVLSQTPKLDS